LSALGLRRTGASSDPAKDRHLRNLRTRERATPAKFSLFHPRVSEVTKLYVGNLPFSATEETVRALFTPHGTVESLSLITDRDTGQPRGFGFVEMSNADASRAMQALNGQDFGGRALKINEAQDKARSGGGGGGNRGGGGGGGPRRY
jgi:cold-inducible RNA-binding protein